MEYVIRDRRWLDGLDVGEVGVELAELAAENDGVLETDAVLARARSEDSALHAGKKWSWNLGPEKVVDQWDRHVARNMARSVLVTFQREDGTRTEPVHAFTAIRAIGERVVTVEALSQPRNRALLIAQAIADVRRLERTLAALIEVGDLFEPVYRRLDAEVARQGVAGHG